MGSIRLWRALSFTGSIRLCGSVRAVIAARLQRLHPDLTPRRLRLAARVAALTALVLVLAQPELPERAVVALHVEMPLARLLRDPEIRAALADQNRRFHDAPEALSDAAEAAWERDVGLEGGAFLNAVLRRPASRRLQAVADPHGVVRHAALFDAQGRTVAASAGRPGYRAAGWPAILALGPGGRRVASPGPDDSQACRLTAAIPGEAGGIAGAIILELDAETLAGTLCRSP